MEDSKSCEHENFICAETTTSTHRKFLVCNKVKRKKIIEVSVQKLKRKSVGLLFVKITSDAELHYLNPLIRVYHQIRERYNKSFEIVFLPLFIENNPRSRYLFYLHLSRMPWPAIPVEDPSNWRTHLIDRYCRDWSRHGSQKILFFDSYGVRCPHLGTELHTFISTYGPDYFPFTPQRLHELSPQYRSILVSKSAQSLVRGTNRDFLVTCPGGHPSSYTKIPISQLNGKYVALYFYHGGVEKENYLFMEKLETYHLRARGHFQVVFINLDYEPGAYPCEKSFRCFLSKWPWLLALPFGDDQIRPLTYVLLRACGLDYINHLVIVSGTGDSFFFDPNGYAIIQEYGYEAYPFTRQMVVSIEKNRLNQLNINDIFEATNTSFLFRRTKKIHASSLHNEKVILFCTEDPPKFQKLLDIQKRNNSFTILLLAVGISPTAPFPPMPVVGCLAFPPSVSFQSLEDVLKFEVSEGLTLAFDTNGKFLKMVGHLDLLETDCASQFPFIADKTFTQELTQVMACAKNWSMEVAM